MSVDLEEKRFAKMNPDSRHYCNEWDGLAIDHTHPEWGDDPVTCMCGFHNKTEGIDSEGGSCD